MKLNDMIWETGVLMALGDTDSRHHIALTLSNSTRNNYLIVLPGAVLEPEDPSYQRLFVAGANDLSTEINLPARCDRRILLATLCLDEQLNDPKRGLKFQVSHKPGPRRLLRAAMARIREGPACQDDGRFVDRPPETDFATLQLMAHGKL